MRKGDILINATPAQVALTPRDPGTCADAAAYCGVRDQVYPDRRSMGFPFDRLPRHGVNTLQQFLTPNMAVADINIRFTNRVQQPRQPENLPAE